MSLQGTLVFKKFRLEYLIFIVVISTFFFWEQRNLHLDPAYAVQIPPVPDGHPSLLIESTPEAESTDEASAFTLKVNEYTTIPFEANWFPITGDWVVEDNKMVQQQSDSFDDVISYGQAFQQFRVRVTLHHVEGAGGGLLFGLPPDHTNHRANMVRYQINRNGISQLIWGYFNEDSRFVGQGFVQVTDPGTDEHVLEVIIGAERYTILVDGEIMAENARLVTPSGFIGLTSSNSITIFDKVEVAGLAQEGSLESATEGAWIEVNGHLQQFHLEPTQVANESIPIEDYLQAIQATATPVALMPNQFVPLPIQGSWFPISGDWVVRDDKLIQQQVDGFDHIISFGQEFQTFRMRVTLHHEQGVGSGLVFGLPADHTNHRAHMVRYDNKGSGIFWGYFDEEGSFVGQGYAPTDAPDILQHTLEVSVEANSYTILLDGLVIAENVRLVTPRGYVGLTSSNSVTVFDVVEVASLVGTGGFTASAETLVESLTIINGDWQQQGNGVQQLETQPSDYVASLGVLAKRYTLQATITLPENLDDAGGGIIFHMSQENSKIGAYMVRIADGGKHLFWGRFSPNGEFAGQGYADVNLQPGIPHLLSVRVDSGKYEISVDENVIAIDIPLEVNEGWIGLVSFRGPVIFSDLRILLGA